jgi:restriction endonuclease Mrr
MAVGRWPSRDSKKFLGALAGQRAKKGVSITTSTFSQQAVEFARSVEGVVLVDKDKLTAFMMEHEVGDTLRPMRIPKLDSDYFEEEPEHSKATVGGNLSTWIRGNFWMRRYN